MREMQCVLHTTLNRFAAAGIPFRYPLLSSTFLNHCARVSVVGRTQGVEKSITWALVSDDMREGRQHLGIFKDEAGSSNNRFECVESISGVSLHTLSVKWSEELIDMATFTYHRLRFHVPAQIPAHPPRKLDRRTGFAALFPRSNHPKPVADVLVWGLGFQITPKAGIDSVIEGRRYNVRT